MRSLSLLPLLLVTACFAAPSQRTDISVPASAMGKVPRPLVAPTSTPTFVTVAVGTYNYTCGFETGTWSLSGPLANVFDISSLYRGPIFSTITTKAYNDWLSFSATDALDSGFASQMINNYGTAHLGTYSYGDRGAATPVLDFTGFTNNPNQFFVGKIIASASSPADSANDVSWLEMQSTSGSLAKKAFLIDTLGGTQPLGTSCNPSYPPEIIKFAGEIWGY